VKKIEIVSQIKKKTAGENVLSICQTVKLLKKNKVSKYEIFLLPWSKKPQFTFHCRNISSGFCHSSENQFSLARRK